MDIDLYQEQLQEAAQDLRWHGRLPQPSETLQRRNASCGDEVQVWVSWNEGSDRVHQVRWEGTGCLISQAAATRMAAWAEGKARTELLAANLETVLTELGLSTIGPGRVRCVLMLLSTLQELAKRGTVASI